MEEGEKIDRESERVKILMDQYKLLEERRKTFGNQFMQVIGFFIAMFTLLVGFLGGENEALLNTASRVAGVVFIIIAFLGYRLGRRQDACENNMAEIERLLREIVQRPISSFPHGAHKFGARKVIVAAMVVGGVLLFVFSFIG